MAERLYHAAELYAATARVRLGVAYPSERLDEGWRLILTNQFHDILPGSAISSVYVDAQADYDQAASIGQEVLDSATGQLAAALNLEADSLVVFNPSPYPSAAYMEVPMLDVPSLPAQPTADGTRLVWCEGVPANGYAAFELTAAAVDDSGSSLRVSTRSIDTPFWVLDIDDRGRITRVFDKRHGREVVPSGRSANRLVVFEDKPLDYDAWDIDAYFAAKSREVDHLERVDVVESGPERGIIEFHWRFGEATRITQRLCVYARLPRIDFVTDVDWQERQSLLKVAFPTDIRNRRATYEIQFGSIDRPTHRNTSWEEAAFEVPAQRWADLSDAHYGVALLADCKHGYSVQHDTLWLSLLKGAIDPDPDADRGEHHFTYSVLPHVAGLDEVRRAAYSLTRPLIARREPAHPGSLLARSSLAGVAEPAQGVLLETAKWAEDEDALILRLYEADGGASSVTLRLGVPVEAVDQVDLLERNPQPLEVLEGSGVPLMLRGREIKTVRVRRARS
jgi:alpha-mannosidase